MFTLGPGLRLRSVLASVMTVAALIACSPFGGADAPPTLTPDPAFEVAMATFTPTEVIPPGQLTATAEAAGTAAVETATARPNLPTPTPAVPTPPPESILNPPLARLETPHGLVDGYLGSHTWQYTDDIAEDIGTLSALEVPLVQFEGDPAPIPGGADLAISLYGEEYRTPPIEVIIEVYDFEANSAIPYTQQGSQGDLAFAIQTAPAQSIAAPDPARPAFTIDVPPGRYAIRVQGRWGPHPDPRMSRLQIFVTWVFDAEVR